MLNPAQPYSKTTHSEPPHKPTRTTTQFEPYLKKNAPYLVATRLMLTTVDSTTYQIATPTRHL